MKKISNNIHIIFLALLVTTMVACGGNSEEANTEESTSTTMQADTAAAPTAKLNVNTASGDKFGTIPNVGDKMVHEFEEYRPYVSIQQFRKEISKYVDSSQVAAYEQYIFVPIHRNDSDAATLMQIPGLDETETEELVAGRPYDSNQAFMDALSSYISEEQMATAESYMKSE